MACNAAGCLKTAVHGYERLLLEAEAFIWVMGQDMGVLDGTIVCLDVTLVERRHCLRVVRCLIR